VGNVTFLATPLLYMHSHTFVSSSYMEKNEQLKSVTELYPLLSIMVCVL